ncbi:copper chaperone PCu(A)C [Shewanella marisflavi]|uniref:copper chaperone PCu(A)C n=1 Tax=Shewanella marisflavi TaxID=260364 RepID=UPI00200DB2FC|nr:copper chaperone PCu(A)C [Shewanella marisflavi]MCL1040130.1 copper chaperone PCu(A)C [Shewanella marisflavi]
MKQVFCLLVLLCSGVGSAQASELMVHDAWIRGMPPTSRVVPVYLSLHNPSNKPLVLKGISSPRGAVELHQTLMENEVMRMQSVGAIQIPPHGMVKLAPSGYHGMMSDFKGGVPALGEEVQLTLTLADGESLSVTAKVTAQGAAHDHSMHH